MLKNTIHLARPDLNRKTVPTLISLGNRLFRQADGLRHKTISLWDSWVERYFGACSTPISGYWVASISADKPSNALHH